jgi:hypothetical protein
MSAIERLIGKSERPLMLAQRAQSSSAELSMAQSRVSIETYHVSTLERHELPTKTAEPWWPLRFADARIALPRAYYFLNACLLSGIR